MKLLIGLILLATILTGCNHIELQSIWKDFEIEIDGKDNDWDDAKIYMKDKNLVVGIANDDEFLYLCFYPTTNRSIKNAIQQGISFWFNTDGKKNRDNGFSYPLAMNKPSTNNKESSKTKFTSGKNMKEERNMNLERLVYNLKLNNNNIEINNEHGIQKIPITAIYGMDICIDAANNVFAYEAKIPLNDIKASFNLGVEAGSEIMIGVQSKAPNDKDMIEEFEENSNQNMEESSPSERNSRKGNRSRNGGLKSSSAITVWMKVKLASS